MGSQKKKSFEVAREANTPNLTKCQSPQVTPKTNQKQKTCLDQRPERPPPPWHSHRQKQARIQDTVLLLSAGTQPLGNASGWTEFTRQSRTPQQEWKRFAFLRNCELQLNGDW